MSLNSLSHQTFVVHRSTVARRSQRLVKGSASISRQPGVVQFDKQDQDSVANSLATIAMALRDDLLTRYLVPDSDDETRRNFVAGYAQELLSSTSPAVFLFQMSTFDAAAFSHRIPEELSIPLTEDDLAEEEAQSSRAKLFSASWNKVKREFWQDHGSSIYISMMGVHPDKQRQGLGGLLLTAICTVADHEKKWCYLEASISGAGLYSKHGFVSLHTSKLGPEAPVVQHMGRPPQ